MRAKTLLSECGLTLDEADEGHVLTVEHPKFTKALANKFKMDVYHPREVDAFLRDFKSFLDSSDEALTSCLTPLTVDPQDETELSAKRQIKESLVRLLVQLEDLQAPLFSHLMEKAVEVAVEEEDRKRTVPRGSLPLSRLILTQVRWLNKIHDPDKMADKMEEMLTAAPRGFVHDLVGALPDVVHESHHSRIAMVLRDLFRDDVDLTCIALDTFTCLMVTDDVMEEIRNSILKKLSSTALEDLPAMFKFLLDSCPDDGQVDLAADLRQKLDFSQSRLMSQVAQSKRKIKKESKDVDVMVVHLLDDSISCSKKMANAWLKVMEDVKSSKDHKPFDFVVLLVLHNLPSKKKSVVSLLKNKVRKGLSESYLQEAFATHPVVIKNFLTDLLDLIDNLSKSSESVLSQFSLFLRREAFLHLDKYCKQEIFADLVGKIGFGGPGRESALNALSCLTSNYTEETAKFGSFVETILDYVNYLELAEVKQVMDALSLLAYSEKIQDPGSTLQSNLHIVLSKQVFSKNPKLVKMGIAGTVVTVKNMTSQRSQDETLRSLPATQMEGSSTDSGLLTGSNVLNAKNLLKRVMAKTKSSGDYGLFMDELSDVMESSGLDSRLRKYIVDKMTSDFQHDYVPDMEGDGSIGSSIAENSDLIVPVGLQYSAVEDTPDFALNIAGYAATKAGSEKADVLLPEFRLLKTSVQATHNDLEDVMGLIDCPIIMPSEENISKFEVISDDEKSAVCACLFYCANWFRELLNAFADTSDKETRAKILLRIKDLLKVNKDLQRCLSEHGSYSPPPVNHLVDMSFWSPPGAKRGGGEKGAKGRKRKLAEIDPTTQCGATQTQSGNKTASAQSDKSSGGPKESVMLDLYQPFFRELEMQVFTVLTYETVAIGSEPTEEEERQDPKLRPAELAFLLSDLQGKLEHSLISLRMSRGFPGQKGGAKAAAYSRLDRSAPVKVAEQTIGWIDALMDNLSVINNYHQRLIEVNEGVTDAPGIFNSQTGVIFECQERIYLCLHTLFSWSGFQSKENALLAKKALFAGAKLNNNKKLSMKSSLECLAEAAFTSFSKHHEFIIHAGGAAAHVRLLTCLIPFVDDDLVDKCSDELIRLARNYLSRDWRNSGGDKEKGARYNLLRGYIWVLKHCKLTYYDFRYNKSIDAILSTLMHQSGENVIEVIGGYVLRDTDAMEEDEDAGGELQKVGGRRAANSSKYPTLTRLTLPLHFRIMLHYLAIQVSHLSKTHQQ